MNKYLGGLEEITLLAVQSLGKDAYGVTIHQALKEQARRDISIGSLYITLGRLEEKGYVASRTGAATAERGGRVRRYFTLTGQGIAALHEAQAARDAMQRLAEGGAAWAI